MAFIRCGDDRVVKPLHLPLLVLMTVFGSFLTDCGIPTRKGEGQVKHQAEQLVGTVITSSPFSDLEGNPYSFDAHKGRRKLVFVFSAWCPHCRREAQELAGLKSHLDARGLELVGLSINGVAVTRQFVVTQSLQCKILLCSVRRVKAELGLNEVPALFALNEENRIIAERGGELSQAGLEEFVAAAVAPVKPSVVPFAARPQVDPQ
jgi:peroxiredoxin